MRQRIAEVLARSAYLVCESAGGVVGFAYGTRFRERAAYRWTIETAVYVRRDLRGRGVGRALYASLLECLKLQGYVGAIGVITLPNAASVALHERSGFREAGRLRAGGYKLGRWHDIGIYALELQPLPGAPLPPLTLSQAEALPAWSRALSAGLAALGQARGEGAGPGPSHHFERE